MKPSTYVTIIAIVAIAYGLALIIIPVKFASNYGTILDAAGAGVAQGWGIALLTSGLIYWLNRNIPGSWNSLLIANIFFSVISIPFNLMSISNGVMNSMGYSSIALEVIFAVVSAYYLFRKK
ncbi:MAG TPA: hypothetical protein VKR53_21445 [Puia sp.]|nr:hypothetical protein [Puia sp.]